MLEGPATGARVEIRKLAKRYATGDKIVAALDGVDLAAEPGALVAIMGPSGSGKSTLLHLVGAMDTADEGEIVVGDRTVTSPSRGEQVEYRRRIGFVFQRFHLLPALTAMDNVLAPVLPYKTEFDKDERGRELLASVGLAEREDALPSELSGGEQPSQDWAQSATLNGNASPILAFSARDAGRGLRWRTLQSSSRHQQRLREPSRHALDSRNRSRPPDRLERTESLRWLARRREVPTAMPWCGSGPPERRALIRLRLQAPSQAALPA